MTIDLQTLSLVLGVLGAMGGMIFALFKLYARFGELEKQAVRSQRDSEILLRTMLGVLNGFIEQGANGPCHEARDELTDYMAKH